jgi:hypothetical protein
MGRIRVSGVKAIALPIRSAESPDGSRWGVRIVRESEGEVDLAIAPFEATAAKLSLDFPGRTQGLPVVASINGAPQPEVLLPPREALDLGELPQGARSCAQATRTSSCRRRPCTRSSCRPTQSAARTPTPSRAPASPRK